MSNKSISTGVPQWSEKLGLTLSGPQQVVATLRDRFSACDVWCNVPAAWLGVPGVFLYLYGTLGTAKVLFRSLDLSQVIGATTNGDRFSFIALSVRGRQCSGFVVEAKTSDGAPMAIPGDVHVVAWSSDAIEVDDLSVGPTASLAAAQAAQGSVADLATRSSAQAFGLTVATKPWTGAQHSWSDTHKWGVGRVLSEQRVGSYQVGRIIAQHNEASPLYLFCWDTAAAAPPDVAPYWVRAVPVGQPLVVDASVFERPTLAGLMFAWSTTHISGGAVLYTAPAGDTSAGWVFFEYVQTG